MQCDSYAVLKGGMDLNRSWDDYIALLRKEKRMQRRLVSIVTAMSVLVSGSVFWGLRGIGAAVTEQTVTDEQTRYIELLSAHPDVTEQEADWIASLPETLTAFAGENAARIAESQLGYTETVLTDPEAETAAVYTRYGAWYGIPAAAWNTLFTSFCLYYAGVSQEEIPLGSGCLAWTVQLRDKGLLSPAAEGEPRRGDILFTDTDGDGEADRSGIVTAAEDAVYTVITGDVDGRTEALQYAADDPALTEYVSLAGLPAKPHAPPDETEEPAAESAEETVRFCAETASGIAVSVRAAPEAFPPDTEMLVSDVPFAEAAQAAEIEQQSCAAAVDIVFRTPDGETHEPACDVQAEIRLPEVLMHRAEAFDVLHVTDDNGAEPISSTVTEEGTLAFTAESFSMYVVTTRGTQDANTATMMINGIRLEDVRNHTYGDPPQIQNSESNRYVISLGETLELSVLLPRNDDGTFPEDGFWGVGNENNIVRRTADGGDTASYPSENYKLVTAKFYGASPGNCAVAFGWREIIYLTVETPIYVETPLGDIHKDRVHEFLDRALWDQSVHVILDEDGNPLYVKNGDETQGRYFLPPNGEVTLAAYTTNPNAWFWTEYGSQYVHPIDGSRTVTPLPMPTNDPDAPQLYRVSQRFKAGEHGSPYHYGDSNAKVLFEGTPFFFHVDDIDTSNDRYHHADIEISDGSNFYYQSSERKPDGSIVTETVEYDAYVIDVDHCYLFDQNGNRVKNYRGEDLEYLSNDYTPEGAPGTSQYELTSQTLCEQEGRDDRWYDVRNVYSAEFKVEVVLKAHTLTRTVEKDGVVTEETVDIRSDPDYPDLETVQTYQLGYDAVIAALNKCPSHTGLDFNIKEDTYLAVVAPQAEKTLNGGTVEKDQFSFELIRNQYRVFKHAVDDQHLDQTAVTDLQDYYSEIRSDRTYKALQIMHFQNGNHSDFDWENCRDPDGFIAEMKQYNPGYDGVYNIGKLIERLNAGAVDEDIDLDTFYSIAAKYFMTENAVTLDDGILTAESGFYLVTEEYVVDTASNDGDGKIMFLKQAFSEPGKYHYTMREIVPDPVTGPYIYDGHTETLTIAVTRQADGRLTAQTQYDAASPVFSNFRTFTLPATGGCGVLPYLLGGGLCIAAAGALMIVKRRREGKSPP